ncbi:MAG: iron ABC transporter permease [Hydrogenophilus sp.]|nr:iron ABC transporter permease [Hydrogenophilus sp.]
MLPTRSLSLWHLITAATLLLVAAPLLTILHAFTATDLQLWRHLTRYLLPDAVTTTLLLLLSVLTLSALLGVALAWLTTAYRFPGSAFFRTALVLPLALPAYVLAFIYLAWFDVTAPLSLWLRAHHLPPPPIRSLLGAALILSLALFPYAFLAARIAFATQGARAIEVGQTLGLTRSAAFWRVVLPLARPHLAAGLALVAFETLADFGAVALLGVDTLSVAIFKTWYGLFSLPTALQLAGILLLFSLTAIALEAALRRHVRYTQSEPTPPLSPIPLSPLRGWAAALLCTLILTATLIAPLAQLLLWAFRHSAAIDLTRYAHFAVNSLFLGASGALVTILLALLLAYARRLYPTPAMRLAARLATAGYALPGAVLAVGIVAALAHLDRLLAALLSPLWDLPPLPLLSGTLTAMFSAYAVRFLAVAFGPIAAALDRITPAMDEAAQTLGARPAAILRRIHLPLLKPALSGAAAFVFIDIVKELPITLMTRPFGWETLATRIFELTNDSRWEEAALPALAVVAVGLLPSLLLALGNRSESSHDDRLVPTP